MNDFTDSEIADEPLSKLDRAMVAVAVTVTVAAISVFVWLALVAISPLIP